MTTGGIDFEARAKEVGIDRATWDLYEEKEAAERDAAIAKLIDKDKQPTKD